MVRFSCEKALLQQAVAAVSRAVAAKSSIPALEGILMECEDGLRLSGYNMQTGIRTTVEAAVSQPGRIVLNARLFGEMIRRLPDDMVTFDADDKFNVKLNCGDASFELPGLSADDYPELPEVDDEYSVTLEQRTLKAMIDQTSFAVSVNETRPIHTGALFEINDRGLTMVAVDGFRLARRTYHPEEGLARQMDFVVPSQGLKELEKILTDSEEMASFLLGSKHILFQVGAATLVCRLLEGDFLDWRRVVPTGSPIKLVANVSDLAQSVERVGLIVSEKNKSPVRCIFSNQEVQMRTSNTLGAAEDKCSFAGDGQETEIGFNVKYLLEALRAVPSEEVTLELTNGLSPIVLTPVDEKYDFAYMVLPVRIKG